jgi:hypothetical protein
LRVEPGALAHRTVEHGVRLGQRIEIDERLGDRAFPCRRILAHGHGDAVEAADRGAAQDVERADAGGRQDETPAVRLGCSEQAIEQGGIGEGADGGHEEIRAALQHALAVRAHRLVAGALGDGIETMSEEALGLVGQLAGGARPLHQHRYKLDVLQLRRLDMLADGAVADETQPHSSWSSTQRAQAISWSSPRCGPISCTANGRSNGPVLKGRVMQGVPSKVQKRLKIGSPV